MSLPCPGMGLKSRFFPSFSLDFSLHTRAAQDIPFSRGWDDPVKSWDSSDEFIPGQFFHIF